MDDPPAPPTTPAGRAYAEGREAARRGLPASSCPYRRPRLLPGEVAWTSLRDRWVDGYFDYLING